MKEKIVTILAAILTFNVVTIIFTRTYYFTDNRSIERYTYQNEPFYQFENATLAYNILNELHKYRSLPSQIFINVNLSDLYYGVQRQDDYCEQSTRYFTENSAE